ncbi:MAG: hypothetical protein K0R50_4815 [Eubacterium sp.]|nr:hypothetical protein [Eubacterium sp.]
MFSMINCISLFCCLKAFVLAATYYPISEEDIHYLKTVLGKEYLELIRDFLDNSGTGIDNKKELTMLMSTKLKTLNK